MMRRLRANLPWIAGAVALAVAAAAWLARAELNALERDFDTRIGIVHRVLSLRAVEHEAILATLALLDTPVAAEAARRLPTIYPRILGVLRRAGDARWGAAALSGEMATALAAAEAASRRAGRAWGLVSDMEQGRLWLVFAGTHASHALHIDLGGMLAAAEWPFAADEVVRVELTHAGHRWAIKAGADASAPWRLLFDTPLAVRSQPFDVVAERRIGWRELPWLAMLGTAAAAALAVAGAATLRQQRIARRRAEELLRLGQVGRLNAMGELAAGMAHELNQPLTAILASTRAAARLLRDDPPDPDTACEAMEVASAQARRAADVLDRLRRSVERPGRAERLQVVDLRAVASAALHLIEPRLREAGVRPRLEGAGGLAVRADPVALEQIIHNLLTNALQALQRVPAGERRLTLRLAAHAAHASLTVIDSGPGISAAQRGRVFEPFYTTRADGLGLGLSLCETLAAGMDGRLDIVDGDEAPPRGAALRLSLPRATAATARTRTDPR